MPTTASFRPSLVRALLSLEGYTVRDLGHGDYALKIRKVKPGRVVIR